MANGDVKKCFGASVKFWRRQLGISQEALAERSNMHRTYICDVERGSRNVSLETIERLAQALEVSPDTLFLDFRQPAAQKNADWPGELPHILIVENDPNAATLMLQAFKRANIANRLQLVRDGEEALDFLFGTGSHASRPQNGLPQMILLALDLPNNAGGLEVLRRLQAHSRMRAIPVVVLAAASQNSVVAESQRLGAKAHIIKPVDFQNFSEAVGRLNLQWAVVKRAAGSSAA